MRIKTYYAKTMADALREIKAELGAEALILSTKEIPCRSVTGRQSSVEVVAAVDGPGLDLPDGGDRVDFSPASRATTAFQPESGVDPDGDVAPAPPIPLRVRRSAVRSRKVSASGKTSRTRKTAAAQAEPQGHPAAGGFAVTDGVTNALLRELISSGVEEWLACKLLQVARGLNPRKRVRSRSALLGLLREAVGAEMAASTPRDELPGRRVVMFFGPTGVGKTTTIAKLAARLTLVSRKKVVLMTVDGFRIGAVEQLRTYASMMGIPFRFVNHISELSKAIEEQAQRDFVLIDTGGFSPRDTDALRDLAGFLQETTQVERHLVLSASTSPADNRAAIERFRPCDPDYLLFTKVDEASRPGPILNELVHTRKPVSYYTNGQRVPQDFHPLDTDGIVDIVLHAH